MSEFNYEFDRLLNKINHNIMKLEERTLCVDRNLNLTINELHLLECIQKATKGEDGPTISAIAAELDITRPSTTVAVNKLKDKKFVEKIGCVNDGRSVRIKLTPKGKKVYALHTEYHENMVKALNECFTDSEKKALSDSLTKINEFYEARITEREEEDFDF